MILLNGTLCSDNFRKTGLIQSCINLATQILCLVLLLKVVMEASPHRRGYFVHGHRINSKQETLVTHILIDIMVFIGVDIIVYVVLIVGLLKKKPAILTFWLFFSLMELILVQISTFYFAVYITLTSHYGASVLVVILPILLTFYLVYNISVVYTARLRMNQEMNPSFSYETSALLVNPAVVSYPQYRIPHTSYIPCEQQHQPSSCSLFTVIPSYAEVAPPPYMVSSI